MARPEVLESILNKLIRINLALGSAAAGSIAEDVAAIATLIGVGTATDIAADVAVTQATLDAVGA